METKNPNRPPHNSPAPGEILFQPVNDGLGFHPFSDGLPYAPISKTPRTSRTQLPINPASAFNGVGAVAAGPPKVSSKLMAPAPRIYVPVAAKIPSPGQPHPQFQPPSLQKSHIQSNIPFNQIDQSLGMEYLAKRMFAYILDTVLNALLCGAVLSQIVFKQSLSSDIWKDPNFLMVFGLFFCVLNWLFMTSQEVIFGTTIGKRLFGLYLRGSGISTFLRALFFLPSVGFFGIGLFWSLVDHRRRCWHDQIVGVQPMELN